MIFYFEGRNPLLKKKNLDTKPDRTRRAMNLTAERAMNPGIGVVVWYRFTPVNIPLPIPEEIMPAPDFNTFKNPQAVIEGYKRVSFLIKKDIVNTVLRTYRYDPTFHEILNLQTYGNMDQVHMQHILASVGTAIMIACFLATNALLLPSPSDV